MDLSISPDLDARVCYAVVFLCGMISARSQIYQRLTELKLQDVWLVPSTWLMFLIYLFIPASLFWLLDRMGAINDTSLFAALLIGLAYPAILSGGFAGLKAPSNIEAIFKPIEAFTSTIIKNVLVRTARIDRALEEWIVSKLKEKPTFFEAAHAYLMTHMPDASKIDTELKALESANPQRSLAADKMARLLYNYLSCIPEYRRIISTEDPFRKALFSGRDWLRSPVNRERMVVTFAIIVGIAAVWASFSFVRDPVVCVNYSVWRLGKAKNSPMDRFRAIESLHSFLSDPATATLTCQKVSRRVRAPDLSGDRVDQFLQLMLCARAKSTPETICSHLLDALRVENVETRSRIHAMLLFFALERDPEFKAREKDLVDWPTKNGDSVTSLETRVASWRRALERLGTNSSPTSKSIQASALGQ